MFHKPADAITSRLLETIVDKARVATDQELLKQGIPLCARHPRSIAVWDYGATWWCVATVEDAEDGMEYGEAIVTCEEDGRPMCQLNMLRLEEDEEVVEVVDPRQDMVVVHGYGHVYIYCYGMNGHDPEERRGWYVE